MFGSHSFLDSVMNKVITISIFFFFFWRGHIKPTSFPLVVMDQMWRLLQKTADAASEMIPWVKQAPGTENKQERSPTVTIWTGRGLVCLPLNRQTCWSFFLIHFFFKPTSAQFALIYFRHALFFFLKTTKLCVQGWISISMQSLPYWITANGLAWHWEREVFGCNLWSSERSSCAA